MLLLGSPATCVRAAGKCQGPNTSARCTSYDKVQPPHDVSQCTQGPRPVASGLPHLPPPLVQGCPGPHGHCTSTPKPALGRSLPWTPAPQPFTCPARARS